MSFMSITASYDLTRHQFDTPIFIFNNASIGRIPNRLQHKRSSEVAMKSRQSTHNPSFHRKSTAWPTVLLLSTLSVSIALTGCGKKDAGAAGASAPPPPEVIVTVAQRAPITQYVELAGRTSAFQLSPVIPQVSGIILKRLFQEGSIVKEGQPLYQIDPALYSASVDAAKAAVQRNKANLAALKITAQRYKDLIASNAVSKLAYDNAMQQVALSEADLASSLATLKTAQINLGYATVRSPITGQSGVSMITAGALVTANQATPLVTIQQMNPIYVDISQSSADMLKLRHQIQSGSLSKPDSASLSLTLEDGSSYPYKGHIEFSNATVDAASGSVILRAVVPNPSGLLLPGMYVNSKLTQGVVNNALLLPQQAVTHDPQGNAVVLVVATDGTVSQRNIQIGAAQGDKWIVTDGLKNGEQVILEGSQKAKPGSKVHASIASATETPTDAQASNSPVMSHAKATPASSSTQSATAAKS
jgi:membrane fusion protein (multidrug efflux system)